MQITALDGGVGLGAAIRRQPQCPVVGDLSGRRGECRYRVPKEYGSQQSSVRLVIADVAVGSLPPLNIAVSTQPVFLPVAGDWAKITFPIGPGHLTAAREMSWRP